MITQVEANTLMALTRVYATRRVRQYAARTGTTRNPNETLKVTTAGVAKATKDLTDFIDALTGLPTRRVRQYAD